MVSSKINIKPRIKLRRSIVSLQKVVPSLNTSVERRILPSQKLSSFSDASIEKRIATLEMNVALLAKSINKEADLEKKQQRENEKNLKKQEENKLRSGEEKQLEKKLSKSVLSPVKKMGSKAGGIFEKLKSFFMLLLGGWLTNQGLDAFIALANGDNDKLESIKNEVIKTLAIVGGIFLALNVGILGIVGTIGKIALAITLAPFKFAFRKLGELLKPKPKLKPPNAKPSGGSKGGPKGDAKPTGGKGSRVTPRGGSPKINPATDAARKKLAKDILDRGLSSKGTMIGGKYVSMTAKEAGEILKKPPGGLAGLISRAWNGVKGFASKAPGRAVGLLRGTFNLASRIPGAIGNVAKFIGKTLGFVAGILGRVGPGLLGLVGNIAKKALGFLNIFFTGKEVLKRTQQGMSPAKALLPVLLRLAVSSGGGLLGGAIGSVLPIAGTGLGYLAGTGLGYWLGDTFKNILDENWSENWDNAPGIKDINGFFGFDSKKSSPSDAAAAATSESTGGQAPPANTSGGQAPPANTLGGTDSNPSLVKPKAANVSSLSGSMPSAPGALSGGGNTTVIYKKVGGSGGQQMQGQPLKTGSATDVPLVASANPSNFYTMYSQTLYNVVI